MNSVNLIGNLTKDPELRYSTGARQDGYGTAVCTFSIALGRGKDRDGNDRGADFPRIVVFGRMAENCDRYLTKGRKVAIQGHIHTDSYKDQEGRTVYTTDVIADRVEFLGSSQNQQESRPQPQYTPQPEQYGYAAMDEDEMPI